MATTFHDVSVLGVNDQLDTFTETAGIHANPLIKMETKTINSCVLCHFDCIHHQLSDIAHLFYYK